MKKVAHNLIIVEGNISAGKTTLSQALAKQLNMRLWSEPVAENPYLEKFYADPKRYALRMQLWLLRRRFETYVEALMYAAANTQQHTNSLCGGGGGVLLDRSIFSDYVFAVQNFRDGNISRAGFDYYMELRTRMLCSLPMPAATLYLNASAKVCHHRIHHVRRRECEAGIGLGYLRGLETGYRDMIDQMRESGSHVIEVCWDKFGCTRSVARMLRRALAHQQKTAGDGDCRHYTAALLESETLQQERVFLCHTLEKIEDGDGGIDGGIESHAAFKMLFCAPQHHRDRAPLAASNAGHFEAETQY